MKILGIDQSFTSTGLCLVDGDSIDTTTIHTSKVDEELDIFRRCMEISEAILEYIECHRPDVIVIEALAFGSFGDATRNLAALQGVIMCDIIRTNVLRGYRINIKTVAPTSLKKFATGNGKAKKKDMLEATPDEIRHIFDEIKVKDGKYDVVDAYFLAKWGQQHYAF